MLTNDNNLFISVFHQNNDHDPFIFSVNGNATTSQLIDIENQIIEDPPERNGEYLYKVIWEKPQIGEFGRIEVSGYWNLTEIKFIEEG